MQRVLIIVVALLLATPAVGYAQITSQALGGGPVLELSPAYPAPHSSVTATLNNYAGDAANNSIVWRVNGKEQPHARNQRELTFTTGNPGERVVVEAITTLGRVQKIVAPHYVDLIVEPQTRVPNHYGGRALPSVGSLVNATVVTSDPTPSSNLIYTWRLNGTALAGGPVRGQTQVSFTMPVGGGILEVLVESTTGVVGAQTIQLMSSEPFLHFYSNNPLYGLSLIPVGPKLTLVGNSATVRAEPYYLDLRTFNNPDLAEWAGGAESSTVPGGNPYEVTILRNETPTSASFHVRNLTEVIQGAQGGFGIQ